MRIKLFALIALEVIAGFMLFGVGFRYISTPPPPDFYLSQAKREWQGSEPPRILDASATLDSVKKENTENNSLKDNVSKKETKKTDSLKQICVGSDVANFDCYEKHYTILVREGGTRGAFADLKERYPKSLYVQSQCHPLTHVIGRIAVENFSSASEAYTQGDSFCWSGYYHGVLEGVIGKVGLTNALDNLDGICKDIPGKESYAFDYYNCVHGLGHGLMAITQNELFETLLYCDRLTGHWEQTSCGGGAFMENIIIDGKNHVTKYLRPSDPLYPCTASPEKYKTYCYLMQTSYMLKLNGSDFKKTFEWCGLAEPQFRDTCYESVGRDASGRSTSNAATTKATCLLGSDENQQKHCVIGAVKDFISYFHSDVQAKGLCNSFQDVALRSVCLETATGYYKSF